MPKATFHCPGKLILLGEHFVVHGVPALAAPLEAVQTEVRFFEGPGGLSSETAMGPGTSARKEPLGPREYAQAQALARLACERLGLDPTAYRIDVRSNVPIGCGLGSSASFAVALVGAAARVARKQLSPLELRDHAHELEKVVHGAPSGVDDTVVALRQAVRFRRDVAIEPLRLVRATHLALASAGKPEPTRVAVARVLQQKQRDPTRFARLCEHATTLSLRAERALIAGDTTELGHAMSENHALLQTVDVSTPRLDSLVEAARAAGALGAKLTGGGLGGYCIALASDAEHGRRLTAALETAGGDAVFVTCIHP